MGSCGGKCGNRYVLECLSIERILTAKQHRHPYRLRAYSPHQLDYLMDHAYGLGYEEALPPYSRLRRHQVPRRTMLRIRRGTADQLCARLFPRPHGAYARRSTVFQGRPRANSEWVLDAQITRLDRHDCLDLLHSELILHRMGKLLRHDWRVPVLAHRTYSASRFGTQLGRVLPGED
jgi:hypothetical protein